MAEADVPYVTPELLDSGLDLTRYFFRTAVEHVHLYPLRLHAGCEILHRDDRWTSRSTCDETILADGVAPRVEDGYPHAPPPARRDGSYATRRNVSTRPTTAARDRWSSGRVVGMSL
jgi:hypothetical protein